MRTILSFLAALLCFQALSAQDSLRYTEDFRFTRGIYTSLEDFLNNSPVEPAEIITDINPASPKFFQYLLAREEFRFPRNFEIVYMQPKEIFGYADQGKVYYSNNYRFETIGKISILREVDVVDSYSSFINPGEQYQAAREEGSGKRYILDLKTGDFFKYKPRKVEKLLERDSELYREYEEASGKRKEKAMDFIKEYNYRNPLYFPKGEE